MAPPARADLPGSAGGPRRPDPWPWLPAPGGDPSGSGGSAGSDSLSDVLARRLLDQRVVLLHGPLDDVTATKAAAELMMLDAEGDDPVTLRVDCGEAPLALALTLMDVVELMGVPVRALCLGQVGEGAVGIVAVCSHRTALPSTRFLLREPTTQFEAHVRNVSQWAELRADERRRFCERVGTAAGHAADAVEEDMARGRFLSVVEAMEYGLLDEVAQSDATLHRLPGGAPPPMGFRPLP
jgi:ATP-dependent Clp protease, protease subunit